MDKTKIPQAGRFTCIVEGCNRPSRAKTKPGKCGPCQASDSYHRKNPNALKKPIGHHGKWAGKQCECGKPVHCKNLCVVCYRKQYKAPKPTPDQNRARRIKHRYGITVEKYEAMVAERGNLCDICGQPPTGNNTRAHWGGKLCIDHDHDTGKVRGLLCNNCNLTVGYGKTAGILERASSYLRLHSRCDC